MIKTVDACKNKWRSLLPAFGVSEKVLNGKHQPCPLCGGKDRFRFDDKDGTGSYFCSGCGAGNGFDLLGKLKGWDFKTCSDELDKIVGRYQPDKPRQQIDQDKLRQAMNNTWGGAQALTGIDPVTKYLENRAINLARHVQDIRYHPNLNYHHEANRYTSHPAMIAKFTGPDGKPSSIHRTYLDPLGKKADVPIVKRMMAGKTAKGGAVRLFAVKDDTLGIAEGIETALAAAQIKRIPVWAALDAGKMMQWEPPEGVQNILIFADNDSNYAGQSAAYALANRLCTVGNYVSVIVQTPPMIGDWNDYLISHNKKQESQS